MGAFRCSLRSQRLPRATKGLGNPREQLGTISCRTVGAAINRCTSRRDEGAALETKVLGVTDELALGTVNAAISDTVSASDLARWIRDEATDEPRQRVALSIFFLEVPVNTQVAFLAHYDIDECKALAFAERIEHLGRPIPLTRRTRW